MKGRRGVVLVIRFGRGKCYIKELSSLIHVVCAYSDKRIMRDSQVDCKSSNRFNDLSVQ